MFYVVVMLSTRMHQRGFIGVDCLVDNGWHCRRLNNLIRAEEEESRFWESMRNTNHDQPVAGTSSRPRTSDKAAVMSGEDKNKGRPSNNRNDLSDHQRPKNDSNVKDVRRPDGRAGHQTSAKTNDDSKSVSKTVDEAVAAAKSLGKMNVKGGAVPDEDGSSRKPRTKNFDKHHQKDKALRKMGSSGF